jgi:hypothetical protein
MAELLAKAKKGRRKRETETQRASSATGGGKPGIAD